MLNRDNYRRYINPVQPLVNTGAYANIERAAGPCWRCVCVYHLSPQENVGKSNIFIDVLSAGGDWAIAEHLRVGWTWNGRQPHEPAAPRMFEKRPPEFRAQVDLYKGQITSLRIMDATGLRSDVVNGLRSDVEDLSTGGNTRFHNSFAALFQRISGPVIAPPIDPVMPPTEILTAWQMGIERDIAELKAWRQTMEGDGR